MPILDYLGGPILITGTLKLKKLSWLGPEKGMRGWNQGQRDATLLALKMGEGDHEAGKELSL